MWTGLGIIVTRARGDKILGRDEAWPRDGTASASQGADFGPGGGGAETLPAGCDSTRQPVIEN